MRLVWVVLSIAGCASGPTDAGLDLSLPDLAMGVDLSAPIGMCDVVLQDCPSGANRKCSLFPAMTMAEKDFHLCVPESGANLEGAPCTRASFGDDDCAKGLACTTRGGGPADLRCRRYCHLDTDCANGQRCTAQLAAAFPMDGVCVASCSPFASDCGPGMSCARFLVLIGSTQAQPRLIWSCRSDGTTPLWTSCAVDTDCVADSICNLTSPQGGVCGPLCDAAHGCPGLGADGGNRDAGPSSSCMPIGNLTSGVCG